MEKLHFNSPPSAEKGPNGGKQLDKIQFLCQETAFSAKRTGYFPVDAHVIAVATATATMNASDGTEREQRAVALAEEKRL